MNRRKLLHRNFTILSLGFIVLGIGCIIWALFSIWTATHYSTNDTLKSYLSPNPNTDKTSIPEYKAENVNEKLDSSQVQPPQDKILYPIYPAEGDNIGSLRIPALNRELPILQGTDDAELKKGVGHFLQSVLPGEKDNCVLSGHRDTVFIEIGSLKIGDQLIVQTSAGTFTYEIDGTRIVHADDKTVIVPTANAVLTLTTCYPFYAIGNAPDRYIVSASLVKSEL